MFVQVSRASARELLRSGFTIAVMVLIFALLLGLYAGIDALISAATGAPSGILKSNLGAVLAIAFMTIAFIGTSVTLVSYRQRGTLRLIGTTPIPRSTFVLGQIPIRLAIAASEILGALLLVTILKFTEPEQLPALAGSMLLGFLMLLSFGFLLGARGSNPDFTMQISAIVPVVAVFTARTVLPLNAFPLWIQKVIDFLPTTWFMDAVNVSLGTGTPGWTLPALWLAMAAVTLAVTLVSATIFRWDN